VDRNGVMWSAEDMKVMAMAMAMMMGRDVFPCLSHRKIGASSLENSNPDIVLTSERDVNPFSWTLPPVVTF